jgi:hypothetical protein
MLQPEELETHKIQLRAHHPNRTPTETSHLGGCFALPLIIRGVRRCRGLRVIPSFAPLLRLFPLRAPSAQFYGPHRISGTRQWTRGCSTNATGDTFCSAMSQQPAPNTDSVGILIVAVALAGERWSSDARGRVQTCPFGICETTDPGSALGTVDGVGSA